MSATTFVDGGVAYVLSSSLSTSANGDDDRDLQLSLCDGTSAWTGVLLAASLKLSKHQGSLSLADFRCRLLDMLRGGARGPRDGLNVQQVPASNDVQLKCIVQMRDEQLDIFFKLEQLVRLRADPASRPGEGLRTMLDEFVNACEALQRECAQHEEDGTQLQVRRAARARCKSSHTHTHARTDSCSCRQQISSSSARWSPFPSRACSAGGA